MVSVEGSHCFAKQVFRKAFRNLDTVLSVNGSCDLGRRPVGCTAGRPSSTNRRCHFVILWLVVVLSGVFKKRGTVAVVVVARG